MSKFLGLFYLIIILIASSVIYFYVDSDDVIKFRNDYGANAILLLAPVQIILSIAPFPSEVIAFGTSALLGFWLGALNTWLVWVVAGTVECLLYRRISSDIKDSSINIRTPPEWLKRFPASHPIFLIAGLYLPFGSHIVAVSAGIYKVPLHKFIPCVAIGYIPLSLFISGLANSIF